MIVTGKPLLLVLLLTLCTSVLFAQEAPGQERYVIIGVFKVMDNAVRFTDKANKLNFHAGYIQNPKNSFYYVHIFHSMEPSKAQAFMMKVRLETEFKEAWVFKGSLGGPMQVTPAVETKPELKKEAPKQEQPKQEELKKEEPKQEQPQQEESKKEEVKQEPVVVQQSKTDSVATTVGPKPVGKPFFFKLTNNDTGEPIVGEIHVLEPNSASQNYQSFPANQVVYLPAPKDPSQVYAITTLSAGFQEMDRVINYADPAASSAEVGTGGSEFVIALPLVHVKMGDYIEFSNVRFFQNSVMLQPQAKEELDGLAELLKQNPRYKVNIHAHCNGTQERNIITRGNAQEFFGTSTGNQRKTVSAKQLTELRAELVKDYLVTQGIEAKRIATKGEGGAALIYPVNSILANRNDRVEVEVKRGK